MGFRLTIEGEDSIYLKEQNIESVLYITDTPDDHNSKATEIGSALEVIGKYSAAVDGEQADDSLKLALWPLKSATNRDCYRKVTLEVINAGQVVRRYYFPNAFVVDYFDLNSSKANVGRFNLFIKQKKDKNELIKIDGGYAAD